MPSSRENSSRRRSKKTDIRLGGVFEAGIDHLDSDLLEGIRGAIEEAAAEVCSRNCLWSSTRGRYIESSSVAVGHCSLEFTLELMNPRRKCSFER